MPRKEKGHLEVTEESTEHFEVPEVSLELEQCTSVPEGSSVTFTVIKGGSTKGRDRLIDSDGYSYSICKTLVNGTRHWRCVIRNRLYQCKAYVVEKNGTFQPGIHRHVHGIHRLADQNEKVVTKKSKSFEKLSVVRDVLKLLTLLENLHEVEEYGLLRDEDMTKLCDFRLLVLPAIQQELLFADKLAASANHILRYLNMDGGKVAGTTYKDVWSVVNGFDERGFFDTICQTTNDSDSGDSEVGDAIETAAADDSAAAAADDDEKMLEIEMPEVEDVEEVEIVEYMEQAAKNDATSLPESRRILTVNKGLESGRKRVAPRGDEAESKPYHCPICDTDFAYSISYYTHMHDHDDKSENSSSDSLHVDLGTSVDVPTGSGGSPIPDPPSSPKKPKLAADEVTPVSTPPVRNPSSAFVQLEKLSPKLSALKSGCQIVVITKKNKEKFDDVEGDSDSDQECGDEIKSSPSSTTQSVVVGNGEEVGQCEVTVYSPGNAAPQTNCIQIQPTKWYVCEYCGFRFAWPQALHKHRAADHPSLQPAIAYSGSNSGPAVVVKPTKSSASSVPAAKTTTTASKSNTASLNQKKKDPLKLGSAKNVRTPCKQVQKAGVAKTLEEKKADFVSALNLTSDETSSSSMQQNFNNNEESIDGVPVIDDGWNVEQPHDRFICSTCCQGFLDLQDLVSHQNEVPMCQGGATYSNATRPFACDTCGESFSLRSMLRDHRRTHMAAPKRSLTCEICGITSPNASKQHRHFQTVHAGRGGRRRGRNADRDEFLMHMKQFTCLECNKSFRSCWYLKRHASFHAPPTFGCPTCGKLFTTKDSLSRHIASHKGLKPFCCKTCGRAFGDYRSLIVHRCLRTPETVAVLADHAYEVKLHVVAPSGESNEDVV